MDYQEYKHDFLETLRNDSAISGAETEDEFLNRTLEILSDFNEIEDPVRIGMGDKKAGTRMMRLDGYCIDETDRSLVLIISDFQDKHEPDILNREGVDKLYWRLYYFLDEVCNGKIDNYFDDSDDIIKISRLIRRRMNAVGDDPEMLLKVKFCVITNKELSTDLLNKNLIESTVRSKGKKRKTKTTKKIKKADFNGKPLEINLWHLERFYEMENSNNNEPIVIDIQNDFPNLGYKGIPCIKGNIGENLGYDAYIAIIPGDLLANIYIEHGSKVLEGNVRAFLGVSQKKDNVNNGIRKTINNDPTKFFTYNNGIATTASDVTIEKINGETCITQIVDLQIINGGQTTASLAEAVLKKSLNKELDGIFVPMKLTVIEDRETENDDGVRFYDEMVQAIAKYANSQNKVTAADLFSNDPFHIWMEKMSKKHLAPPARYPIPTGWYYERSRKRYEQEQFKLGGEDAKRFAAKFPKKQIINKEKLAIYMTAIDCKPYVVSKGKNWVFKEFAVSIGNMYKTNRADFNEFYFKKCICAAIIFTSVDGYLEKNKDSAKKPTGFWYKTGGYKGNIVPYTIAKILSSIPKGYTLNWDYIWQKQALSPAFMREVEKVTKITNDFICDSHGVIVTEYCKRASTWEEYRDTVKYELSADFINELMPESLIKEKEASAKAEQKEINDLQVVMDIVSKGVDYWNKLMTAGVQKSLLSYQEQTAINQIINMAMTGNVPASASGKVPYKTMTTIRLALAAKDKLEAEGISI